MIIGAFSDIHGDMRRWRMVHALAVEHSVSFLICAGDVTPIDSVGQTPLLIVFGNHDDLDEVKRQRHWLVNGSNSYKGWRVFAINGNFAAKRREPYHNDARSLLALFKTCGSTQAVDIVVTHEPPCGVRWRGGQRYQSVCSQLVTEHIRKMAPGYWVYGHCRMEEPIQKLDGIVAMNVNNRMVIWNPAKTPCLDDFTIRDLRPDTTPVHDRLPA